MLLAFRLSSVSLKNLCVVSGLKLRLVASVHEHNTINKKASLLKKRQHEMNVYSDQEHYANI